MAEVSLHTNPPFLNTTNGIEWMNIPHTFRFYATYSPYFHVLQHRPGFDFQQTPPIWIPLHVILTYFFINRTCKHTGTWRNTTLLEIETLYLSMKSKWYNTVSRDSNPCSQCSRAKRSERSGVQVSCKKRSKSDRAVQQGEIKRQEREQ
jgi:hypothetical protein